MACHDFLFVQIYTNTLFKYALINGRPTLSVKRVGTNGRYIKVTPLRRELLLFKNHSKEWSLYVGSIMKKKNVTYLESMVTY